MSKETDEAAQMGTNRERYFSQLRHQVRTIDRGVKAATMQIDMLGKDFENYCDESEGMHFLQFTQTEIKTMRENIKHTQADLETRNVKANSIQNLLPSILANFKSRLESVETFMEHYGYKRPEFKLDEQVEDPNHTFVISSTLAAQKLQPQTDKEIVESEIINLNSDEQNNGEQSISSNEYKYEMDNDSPRTPKLEGISERTQMWLDEIAESKGWRSKHTTISTTENSNNKNALQSSENNSFKNVLEGAVATPELDAVTESTMQRLEKMTYHEKTETKLDLELPRTPKLGSLTENTIRLLQKMGYNEPTETNSDVKLPSSPNLEGLSGSNRLLLGKRIYNEKTEAASDFELLHTPKLGGLSKSTMQRIGKMSYNEKDAIKPDFQLPSTPKLESLAASTMRHFKQTSYNENAEKENYRNELGNESVFCTPKLEGISEKTMKFLDELEAKNEKTQPVSYDFENYDLLSTPKLDLEGMSEYTLNLLNNKN